MTPPIKRIVVALFALGLVFSISVALILGAILLLDWAYVSFRNMRREPWVPSALDWPIIIFLLWGVVCSLLGKSLTLREAISVQSALFLFYYFSHGSNPDEMKVLLKWFCLGSVVAGAWALVQYFSGVDYQSTLETFKTPTFAANWPKSLLRYLALREGRAMGTRSHPLTYAEGLMPALFFLFSILLQSLLSQRKNFSSVWKIILSLILVGGGLLLSQGRGIWLGSFLGLMVMGSLMPKRFGLLFILAILFSTILGVSLVPSLKGRMMSIFSSTSGEAGGQQSKETRLVLWKESFLVIKDNPLCGVGLKGAKLAVHEQAGLRVRSEAHNIFFQVAVETGIVGLGLFVWILFVVMRIFWQIENPWRGGLVGLYVAFLIAGLTESWMGDKEVAMIFWTLVGCATFLSSKKGETVLG